jgi:hypothetical protein
MIANWSVCQQELYLKLGKTKKLAFALTVQPFPVARKLTQDDAKVLGTLEGGAIPFVHLIVDDFLHPAFVGKL